MADQIATIFLSPFLQVFFERMAAGEFVDFFKQRKLSDGLIKKLKTTFQTLSAVLEDAEESQVTKPAVKDWLVELKDAVYDAEHILDEIATEALRSKLDAQFQTTTISKVRKSLSAFRNSFVKEIEPKIKEILERLESLKEQKGDIGLREGVGGKSSKRPPTTSLVEESDICGRGDDKEAIIKMLLSDDVRGNRMGVIAIVGMGGIGKTTLAQLVYNDNRVKEHFNLEAWVCVSENFDLFKITRTIVERVTSSTYDNKDLDVLQSALKEKLVGKKFLLVLDDVWNKDYVNWEDLSKPFKSGAQGSRVIVTTRDHDVASVMRASSTHPLKKLPEEHCWSLFTKHAFHDGNPNAHPWLEELGRQIVEKCDGLPLAVKTIGALLRPNLNVDEWEKILKSELWDLPIDETKIVPALRLSYKYLPSHLKRCFAYCSIFPKDYLFKKHKLVLLWMAEGFLHESKTKTMEEVGDDYFFALVSRSLFQQSSGNKSLFIMHDLVNDLATFVSGQFTVRMDGDYSKEIDKKVRHLSYVQEKIDCFKKFEALYDARKLCTFLPIDLPNCFLPYLTKKVPHELLPMLTCLRVLSLFDYSNMTELSDSIGKLKHLRYLDLSYTRVRRLPDSICQLCNLQTLILTKCRELAALPRDMWKLMSLRHLDIAEIGIKEMPIHLGRLKFLQTLTKFVVSKGNESCIGELGKLVNLRGSLSILELQNVESHIDALNVSLRDKKYLEDLVLEWNVDTHFSESQRSVLDSLRPHTNLKCLTIQYYGGKSFSDWVGHPSFSNIASLRLHDCKFCSTLPTLGQLHSLQNLSIVGFDEVVTVGREFCGSGSSSVKPFGALKVLRFEKMPKWEEWISFGDENGGVAFPQLEELYISRCPKLIGGFPIHLPSLAKLEIYDCQQLVASLQRAPTIRELELGNCNEVLLKELPTEMQKLKIEGFYQLESLPEGIMESKRHLQELQIYGCSSLTSLPKDGLLNSGLQKLVIHDCSSLVSLPKDGLPSTLKFLRIRYCMKLESLPEGMIDSNNGLENLVIHACSSLVSLSKDGLPSTLKFLRIHSCMKLELPTHMEYSSLENLVLVGCDSLKSFPLDLFPKVCYLEFDKCSNLEYLTVPEHYEHDLVTLAIHISDCHNFVSFPKGGLRAPNLTSFSVINCGSLRSLPEKMHILLPSLDKLSVIQCPEAESFPERGLPSNLKFIDIHECDKLFASWMGWGLQNLPFLRKLSISVNFKDVESFTQLLPTSLTFLSIFKCQNLKSLKGLQHLIGLQELRIRDCPQLKYMPEQELPASLSILVVYYCPMLKKGWQSKKSKKWRKNAHIKQIWIDGNLIE